ncbi:MAG: formylmethanofuran dehydrogenase subunit B [Theionarchaea archaeon]|nr:formylmethanofuran dehydrogenase subunit B [Theionarchaea archaeon]MBU7000688.1 formylmethanofuran dehydrogenase subunit B [Theionarchaea archaeon]MBU7020981.1 formylmethanofuran dehydrogenase subunit B [Theionarchaea archaeon]MBU7034381.1 formylmethanofuran dehydrogenase subunit B [Theionarchaea archaeon]MBU7040056.1 formylmethanofuran dehydrogenase subunit B [Theionarchaea archaeon]
MIHENVVCPFCGCLCDDIVVTTEDNQITDVKNACAISKSKFLNHHVNMLESALVDGKEVSMDEAVDRATEILSSADNPLIYGLSSTECEAQRHAIHLAELLGATIDQTASVCHGPTILGTQDAGCVKCTLGEVKNRADLIIYWGCNPAEAHIRHFRRYSVFPEGLFRKGRNEREVVVVDVRATASARIATTFVKTEPGTDFENISLMRAYLKGKRDSLPDELRDLVEKMKTCTFGIIFFGLGLTMSKGKHLNVDAALRLVRDLNEFTKFSITPMRGHYNVTGAGSTMAWVTGYPFSVNFALGYPLSNPGEFSAVDVLARKECDAALIIASDPAANFPAEAWKHLADIPTIVMDPKVSLTTRIAKVSIPVATAGIEAEGTAYRMDGIPLRLKKIVQTSRPSDAAVLTKMIEKVRA